MAYLNSAGKIVLSRGALKKIRAPAGTDLALSHDGKELLYTRSGSGAESEHAIVLYDFDTGRSKDLVHGAIKQPFWSPDDTRVAYLINQDQKWQVWTFPHPTQGTPAPPYATHVTLLPRRDQRRTTIA